jgi:hypothetical protein
MRASTSIIVVVVVCLAALALYWFIGRNQLQKQVAQAQGEVKLLKDDLAEIERMEQEIPQLLAKLPVWQRQYELFRSAIPVAVDDHRFLSAIVDQLEKTGVQFNSSELAMGGLWLDGVSESQFEQLKAAGLDVDTAKQIKVAFYSLNLSGDYGGVLTAFEGLKRYGRLFTIDQVQSEAGGAAGTVVENVDLKSTPLEMTGRIYFGIPENYFNVAAIQRLFAEKGTGVAARSAADSIKSAGRKLSGAEPSSSKASADGSPDKQEPAAGSNLTAGAGEAS